MASANSNGPVNGPASSLKAVLYARYSPRPEGTECDSNETQIAYCREYCQAKGYNVVGVFEDKGYKGDDPERPGLWAAIDALKRGMVIVAHKNDRLARSVYLDEYIRREVAAKRATIEVVDGGWEGDSPQDVMVRQILAAVAEAEKKIIAARTKASMLHYQSEGRAMSKNPPFGKREGEPVVVLMRGEKRLRRMWEDDPEELRVIARIEIMREKGLSYREISRRLNDTQTPCRGREWHPSSVRAICLRQEEAAEGVSGGKASQEK